MLPHSTEENFILNLHKGQRKFLNSFRVYRYEQINLVCPLNSFFPLGIVHIET